MKKNLANNFLRKIVPLLLVCGLLVGISGITLSPQKTSAAYYPYADLNGALLPGLKQDLQGYTVTLNGMGLSATDAAPVRRLIESAATQVQTAIDTMEDTPAWIASANDAVAATDAARTGLWSLQQGGSPSQQTNLSRMEALCNANDPSCTPAMRAQITSLRERIASRGVVAAGGTPQETCDSWALFKPVCWIRLISVVIGSLLISIAAMFLALADMLFNWTVLNTILLFSTEIFAKVKDGINAGWTAMRDIANIVIIGMFTFIAISTILGIQEYAAKKLLARVLIIAVLINFSLLFTKIIIDASNFTAAQFYASTVGANSVREARDMAEGRVLGTAPVAATVTSSSLEEYRGIGISGAFIRFLGVTSVSKTYESLDRVANNGGGWYVALAHGLLGALLLGGAAGVLFYGAYLLISRAVLFIFLMVTAAGAFATHLIPKMNESTYGWQGWWSSLLHNAALAPLLMIFLYITLRVAANITPTDSALGTLASPTAASTDIKFLFLYFIILGLLWGSFLLASKWASKVGGLGFTGTILGSAAVGAAGLASRFIAAPLLRQTVGRGAYGVKKDLLKEAKQERSLAGQAQRTMNIYKDTAPQLSEFARREMERLRASAAKKTARAALAGKVADSRFNVMDIMSTAPAKKVMEAIGKATGGQILMKGESSKETKGFEGDIKEKADAAAKKAEGLTVSEEEKNELRERARKQIYEQRKTRRALEEVTWKSAQTIVDAVREKARTDKARLEPEHQTAKTAVSTEEAKLGPMLERHQNTILDISNKINDSSTPRDEIPTLQGRLESTQVAQNSEMMTQKNKIEQAHAKVKDIENQIAKIDSEKVSIAMPDGSQLESSVAEVQKIFTRKRSEEAEEFARETDKLAGNAAESIVSAVQEGAVETAAEIGRREVWIPRRWVTGDDELVADEVRKKFKHKVGTARIKSALEDFLKEEGGGTAKPEAKPVGPAGLPPTH